MTKVGTPERRQALRSEPASAPMTVRFVYAVMSALLVGYVISEIVRRNADSWPLIDDWGVAGFEIAGSLLCLARGLASRRLGRSARLVPLMLGCGTLSWALGDLVLAIAGQPTSGTPAAVTALYLGFYPLAYVGVMLALRLNVTRFTSETWLDGLIVGLGSAAVSAAFLFNSVLHAAGGEGAAVATNLAYPVGDLLLLALVAGGTTVLTGRYRLPWVLLAVGLAVNTLGDTANLFASGLGATHLGAAVNACAWPTAILLVSVSVWVSPGPSAAFARVNAPSFTLPALASLGATGILFAGSIAHIDRTALVLALATLTVAGLRAGLSINALRRLTEDRRRQAVTDELTSLGNRRALFDLLDELEHGRRHGSPARTVACLFIDLNRFKEVNDAFGHTAGDELLRQLGQRLRGSLRDTDLLTRLGGDEFVVVLPDADHEYGATVAQRIGEQLREGFELGPVSAQIGASVGIAVWPGDATDPVDLVHCADLAMYRAKVASEPFGVYNEELDLRANRFGLVEDLRSAIGDRALEVHYQPQVRLEDGVIVALEALVRWRHPRIGPIPPLEFLPLAEDADLMEPLTELVLDTALAQCARWRGAGHDIAVCVNLSASSLVHPDLPARVQAALTRHGLPAAALVLEITETRAITDLERATETIARLRDLGFVVSVDDFGAGFTSLTYLSELAVGELKIDRSFVQGLAEPAGRRNEALIRSTIELAHSLGMRVVAEGIEDEASFALLAALGCDRAQGYLVSRPLPAEALELDGFQFALDGAATDKLEPIAANRLKPIPPGPAAALGQSLA